MKSPGDACAGTEDAVTDPHVPLVPAGGDAVERPEQPGSSSVPCPVAAAAAALSQARLGTHVDLPTCPGGTARAAAAFGDISSDEPVPTPARPISPLLGRSEGSLQSTGVPPACPSIPGQPVAPAQGLSTKTSTPPSLPAAGLEMDAGAPMSSAPPLCPPFHCTQDEKVLTLLLEVPNILPGSLKGEVGTNHYKASFATQDSAPYSFFLQSLPENKLTPPEMEASVSPNNAVIVLAKSPESAGLWTKVHFGPNADRLQERWLVTEDTVAEFLGRLPQPPSATQPEMDQCPLIEVLDVSEGQSQVRLKARGHPSCQPEQAEPGREDDDETYKEGSKLSEKAEKGPIQRSGSCPARETMGRVGREPDHCSEPGPADPSADVPEKVQSCLSKESGHAPATSEAALSPSQAPLDGKAPPPPPPGEEGKAPSESSPSKARGSATTPPPPVIKETNLQDGSVRYISHHATRSAVTFQNSLLYELD